MTSISRHLTRLAAHSLAASAPALLIAALLVACDDRDKGGASVGVPGTTAAADVEPADPAPPVVAEDPEIPLHEAVVGTVPELESFATEPPPGALVEDPPPRPRPGDQWIPGYWWWSERLARHVWITGAWRSPPPEQLWYPGAWAMVAPGRYAWSPGFWAPPGFVREPTVDVRPPPLRVEVIGLRPEPGVVWTPGYYRYRADGYVWVAGSWVRPPAADLVWVEPRYVGRGGRYYFHPGRWDFIPAKRGTAYLPSIHVHEGSRVVPVAVGVAVVSAQTKFVSGATSVVAHGGTRTQTGAFTVRAGTIDRAASQARGGGVHGEGAHGEGADEAHGAPRSGAPTGTPAPHGAAGETPRSGVAPAHQGGPTATSRAGESHGEPAAGTHRGNTSAPIPSR